MGTNSKQLCVSLKWIKLLYLTTVVLQLPRLCCVWWSDGLRTWNYECCWENHVAATTRFCSIELLRGGAFMAFAFCKELSRRFFGAAEEHDEIEIWTRNLPNANHSTAASEGNEVGHNVTLTWHVVTGPRRAVCLPAADVSQRSRPPRYLLPNGRSEHKVCWTAKCSETVRSVLQDTHTYLDRL